MRLQSLDGSFTPALLMDAKTLAVAGVYAGHHLKVQKARWEGRGGGGAILSQ